MNPDDGSERSASSETWPIPLSVEVMDETERFVALFALAMHRTAVETKNGLIPKARMWLAACRNGCFMMAMRGSLVFPDPNDESYTPKKGEAGYGLTFSSKDSAALPLGDTGPSNLMVFDPYKEIATSMAEKKLTMQDLGLTPDEWQTITVAHAAFLAENVAKAKGR